MRPLSACRICHQYDPDKSQETNFGSLITIISDSSSISLTFFTSIPHSRITFKYLPAKSTLCFHGCKNDGTQAPPGSRLVPTRGGGTPPERGPGCFETFEEPAREDPSRSYVSMPEHFRLDSLYTAAPNTRPCSRSPRPLW